MLKIKEKELQEHIYKKLLFATPDELKAIGLERFIGYLWETEVRIGEFGIADLVGYKLLRDYIHPFGDGIPETVLKIEIIELKVEEITARHTNQLLRYLSGINYLLEYFFHHNGEIDLSTDVSGALIGPAFKDGLYHLELSKIHSYTYDFGLEGIQFTKFWVQDLFPSIRQGQEALIGKWLSDLKYTTPWQK